MTYQKAITNAETGLTDIVDLSPEEVAEVEARLAASRERQVAEVAAQIDLAAKLAALPTADDISNAKSIAELKIFVAAQNALLAELIARIGL